EGRPGTLMPAFAFEKGGQLKAEQVRALAEGIKRRWGTAASAPSEAPPYLPAQTQPAAIPEAAGAPERIRVPRDAVKTNADAMPVDPAVPELIRVPPRPRAENSPAGAAAGKKEEGGKVFARACASCHGDHGQGGRYGGKTDGRSVGAINHPD